MTSQYAGVYRAKKNGYDLKKGDGLNLQHFTQNIKI